MLCPGCAVGLPIATIYYLVPITLLLFNTYANTYDAPLLSLHHSGVVHKPLPPPLVVDKVMIA